MITLSLMEAAHLARRAGFSATLPQVEQLQQAQSRAEAVALIMEQTPSLLPLPDWQQTLFRAGRGASQEERQQQRRARRLASGELKFWWFQQMLNNSAPLQERMMLFWSNHFTSSLEKVKEPALMLQQHMTLRQHAMGSFRDMLRAMLQDPAMLLYLDNATSRRESPNENFARELLELFTLGEGHYSEVDIKELARALTGATVNRRTGGYQFRRRFHDSGSKTIFAQTAAFTPDDVADLILSQPQVGTFIADKLWRYFVAQAPSGATLEALGQAFVASDFAISELLEAIFNHDDFWQSMGNQIKSPMELMVGTLQALDAPVPNRNQVVSLARQMGQDLFDPPNVKGWPGGLAWYTTATLPARDGFVRSLLRHSQNANPDLLLAVNPVGQLPANDNRRYGPMLLQDPAYQVV